MPASPGDDYDRIRQVLERAVARICPARWADRRLDIVQAALLRLLEMDRRAEIASGGEKEGPRSASYLWQVAYTAMVDEMRRVGRRREVSLDDARAADPAIEAPAAPDGHERCIDLGRAIQGCLERLVEPRRLAVALHLEGFRAAESARALGWDITRIRNLVFRGMDDLRRCLEGRGVRP